MTKIPDLNSYPALFLLVIVLPWLQIPVLVIAALLFASFHSSKNSLFSLLLLSFFCVYNSAIIPEKELFLAARPFFLVLCLIRLFMHLRHQNVPVLPFLFNTSPRLSLFYVAIAFHSLFFSSLIAQSFYKSLYWIFFALFVTSMLRLTASDVSQFFYSLQDFLFKLVILGSFYLLIPSVGFFRNGTGFQGLFSSPQALALIALVPFVYGISSSILHPESNYSVSWPYIVVPAINLILTESRTAFIIALLTLMASIAILSVRVYQKSRVPRVLSLLIVVTIVLLAFFFPLIVDFFSFVLSKSGRADVDSLNNLYHASRGSLLEGMIDNIQLHPWSGIGFAAPSLAPSSASTIIDAFDPASFSAVEKGNFYFAVLEECGIPLGSFFLMVLFSAIFNGQRLGAPFVLTSIALLLTLLSESYFFSPGGVGGLLSPFLLAPLTLPFQSLLTGTSSRPVAR